MESEVVEQEAELKRLMLRGLDGDAEAWRAFLLAIRRPLQDFFRKRMGAGHADIEDVVQDTLLAIHAKRATFDRSQAFGPWCYAVARYKMIDHLRRQGRRPTTVLDDAERIAGPSTVESGAIRRDLSRLLARLPLRQRRLIEDTRLAGYSMAEAAERQGMTEGAAKVSVHRGLKTLSEKAQRDAD
jgi:RNA polymerase sigma-70 factor (ECF subfamily)